MVPRDVASKNYISQFIETEDVSAFVAGVCQRQEVGPVEVVEKRCENAWVLDKRLNGELVTLLRGHGKATKGWM